MTDHLSERTRWAIVVAFAIAMAWVEAASVLYIRALVDRISRTRQTRCRCTERWATSNCAARRPRWS